MRKETEGTHLFIKSNKTILRATHVEIIDESDNRCLVEINQNIKSVYAYLLDQYISFCKSGNRLFQSYNTLSNELGMSESTIKRSIFVLEKIGLILVDRKLTFNQRNNVYTVYNFESLNIRLFSSYLVSDEFDGFFWPERKQTPVIKKIEEYCSACGCLIEYGCCTNHRCPNSEVPF